jgi:hypothetical protein
MLVVTHETRLWMAQPSVHYRYGALARDGESEPGQGAIGHPRVQIEEGAGVDAFLVGEPRLLVRGGYGPVAAQAY